MCSHPWSHNPLLVEIWENSLHVGLVKIPSNNEKALSVNGLQLTDGPIENTHSLFNFSTGGHIHRSDDSQWVYMMRLTGL